MPTFSETVYGWGLEVPAVVLVDTEGGILYRGDTYFSPAELRPYLGSPRLIDRRLVAGSH